MEKYHPTLWWYRFRYKLPILLQDQSVVITRGEISKWTAVEDIMHDLPGFGIITSEHVRTHWLKHLGVGLIFLGYVLAGETQNVSALRYFNWSPTWML